MITAFDRIKPASEFAKTPEYQFCPDSDWWKCGQEYSYAEESEAPLEAEFRQLVETWRKDTRKSSVVALRYIHPAYQRILALPNKELVIGLILRELATRPDRWLAALSALTNDQPTEPNDSFDDAVQAWLEWGRERGYNV
jgi:hypothetical protein